MENIISTKTIGKYKIELIETNDRYMVVEYENEEEISCSDPIGDEQDADALFDEIIEFYEGRN